MQSLVFIKLFDYAQHTIIRAILGGGGGGGGGVAKPDFVSAHSQPLVKGHRLARWPCARRPERRWLQKTHEYLSS